MFSVGNGVLYIEKMHKVLWCGDTFSSYMAYALFKDYALLGTFAHMSSCETCQRVYERRWLH